MYQLLESIKVKNGKISNRPYHEARMNKSRQELFGMKEPVDLSQVSLPVDIKNEQIYKCRIIYRQSIENITFREYIPKKIHSLQVVHDNDIQYSFKYLNRQHLDQLKKSAAGSDEIIIVKNGWVSDATYANLVFFDGEKWVTPSSPLLKGTKRAFYLDRGIIHEASIRESDIFNFQRVCLINAMLDIEDGVCVGVEHIYEP